MPLTILGNTVREPVRKLETFEAPATCTEVTFETNEWTSLCPVTGQPDFGRIRITYGPNERCIESKSLKLYIWSFRDEAHFVEQLAHIVANDVSEATGAKWVEVEVVQNVRGGIETTARAEINPHRRYEQEDVE